MAVYFTFAAFKALKSVPCVGNSISLLELKDAIAAPLVAALRGRKLREQFDFRVFDVDTKEEIVGENARVRKYASVLVKRVPAYVLSQKSQPPVVVSSSGLEAVNEGLENVVIDDGFGEDVYSSSSGSTKSTVSTVSAVSSIDKVENIRKGIRKSSKAGVVKVIDGGFKASVCSRPTASVVSSEKVEKVEEEIRITRKEEMEAVGDVPEELMCTLCKQIMKDPVLIPCCCNSFCHNCIKVVLTEEKKCPTCESARCTDADLLCNRHLKSMIDVYFKSNPSVSSSGSCSSSLTTSQVCVGDLQLETLHKMFSNPDIHVSKSVGSGLLGKRKPLVISLKDGLKRTKVL